MIPNMKHLTHLLAASLILVSTQAGGETLEEAWTAALGAHRHIAAATANRNAATFELEQAEAARLPQLGLSGAYTALDEAPGFSFGGITTDPIFAGDDFFSAGAQINLPVYAGGAINAGVEAAEFGVSAASSQLAVVTQEIRLGAAEHYFAVLRAESAVTVAESYASSLRTHTDDTRSRFEYGDVPRNDFLAASVTLADAEQQLLQAQNNLDHARAAYNRFLGRPLTDPVSLDRNVGVDNVLPSGAGLQELISIAREQRHELDALDAHADSLMRQADRARAAARPQLALTGGYQYLENEFLTRDQFWMAGVAVRWNLFDGGQARKKSASLEQKAIAVDHNRADLDSQISLQVRRAWNDRIEAENRFTFATDAVAQSEENLRVVRERYQAGSSRNVEVLDAAALHERTLSNRDDARFEVALSKLRLARATGML